MFRYILFISLLVIFATACTSPVARSQPVTTEEIHQDEPIHEEAHNDEEKDSPEQHEQDEEHQDEEKAHKTDEGHRDHEAHEHGAAELMIAWSGNNLAIDLQTPAYNILGFEHAPSTDAEQKLLDESVVALEAGELLQFSPDANCTLISATVKTELAEETHEGEEEIHESEEETHESDAEEESHSDIDVSYNIECEQPGNLESLDLSKLFAQFPNFENLRAQWISDAAQSAKTLTADDSLVSFQ